MTTTTQPTTTSSAAPAAPPLDLAAIKTRQQATWATGDYAIIGRTLQIVGESLCEAVDLRAGERVLDVACGNGNATLAAARRHAEVTGLDYVPALLDRTRARAEAEGLAIELREGDLEKTPFADGAFDVVLSTFGCMFAPDQDRTAAELARVCRPGGRIGLANWTPDGFIGQLFKVVGGHVPPPTGLRSPALWGTEARLHELFDGHASRIEIARKEFVFRYASAAHWLEIFRRYYGPVNRAFAALGGEQQDRLAADITALLARFDRGEGRGMVVPGEYLEVVVHRA